MIYLELFLTFLQIGAVCFGGGYAMIPLIRDQVVLRGWLTEGELLNMIAVSESTPGPIAVNMATFVGSSQGGVLGALVATLGVVLPSFLIILIIAALIRNLLQYQGVQAFLRGIRPCVVGLILSTAVTALFVPMAGFYIALSIAYSATGENLLGKLRDLCRWCMEWALKLTLYLFTGYMTITGVISGTADAVAGKAAKITISGAVPVVGGILSDAAEAVVLSASVLGGSAGIWGILTVIAIFCAPAVAIGVRYLLLKVTAAVCSTLGAGRSAGLIGDLSAAMGLLLALVSTQAVLLLISSVCFLMGVAH